MVRPSPTVVRNASVSKVGTGLALPLLPDPFAFALLLGFAVPLAGISHLPKSMATGTSS